MTEMYRGYRYTLDPTPSQAEGLAQHVGASRFVYNHMLALVKENLDARAAEKEATGEATTESMGWSFYSLRNLWNELKGEAAPWWGEVSKEAFASGCRDLSIAFKNWSDSKKGKRKGKKVGFPGFKRRSKGGGTTFTTGAIRLEADRHHITLPRLGAIHTLESTRKLARLLEQGRARILAATISQHRGRWTVSLRVVIERDEPQHPNPGSVVGVDVGCGSWMVAATPDGEEVLRVKKPKKLAKLDRRKRALQRRHRNKQAPDKRTKQAPSNRWRRAQKAISKIDHRIANIRDDVLHKATTTLARKYETIVVEDLNVAAMMTRGGAYKRGLNRSIATASMARLRDDSAYKTEYYGGKLHLVDRFYPSSKTCSNCGEVKAKLSLTERVYHCAACGATIDRDLNAAINLAGSAPVTGRGATQKTSISLETEAAGYEASTPLGEPLLVTAKCKVA